MNFKLSPLIVLCAILAGVLPLGAQQKGQYVPGQFGLNAGIMPSPGFTYTNMEINYNTDTLNNHSGNAVPPKPTLNLWVVENMFEFVPNTKFLGGNLGFLIIVPTLANGSLTLEQVNVSGGPFAITDPLGNTLILPASTLPFYSVHAVGGQATFILPKRNLALFFKYEHEYAAYSHTLGNTLVFGGSWTLRIPESAAARK